MRSIAGQSFLYLNCSIHQDICVLGHYRKDARCKWYLQPLSASKLPAFLRWYWWRCEYVYSVVPLSSQTLTFCSIWVQTSHCLLLSIIVRIKIYWESVDFVVYLLAILPGISSCTFKMNVSFRRSIVVLHTEINKILMCCKIAEI